MRTFEHFFAAKVTDTGQTWTGPKESSKEFVIFSFAEGKLGFVSLQSFLLSIHIFAIDSDQFKLNGIFC
ncbi:hypothetical protein MRB53_003667 [Persea americana]|uniref:Uncharacterized protein n=1 Tax=Persea americana TaxID=3435 RepID=A0ACC2MY54_PERAE|nr:hypothetical protein MRB53_003667 [Persea americana]